jgi:Ca2+-binding RTX toxin-like protein
MQLLSNLTKRSRSGLTGMMLALLLVFAAAGTANAGSITGNSTSYTFTDSSSEANDLYVSYISPTQIQIDDYTSSLTESSSNCTSSGGSVTCTVYSNGNTGFKWNLGGNNDTLFSDADVNLKDDIDGGTGGDAMYCGDGTSDVVNYSSRTSSVMVTPEEAGSTNDGEVGEFDAVYDNCEIIQGGSASDTLYASTASPGPVYGNDGNDKLTAGENGSSESCDWNNSPKSQLLGGDGDDALYAIAGRNRLSGQDGSDVAIGGTGCDNVEGGAGSDTLIGGRGNDAVLDHFETSTSNVNVLDGGDGADLVVSGAGSDTLILSDEDEEWDDWACNYGTDLLIADSSDEVASIWESGSCERSVIRP